MIFSTSQEALDWLRDNDIMTGARMRAYVNVVDAHNNTGQGVTGRELNERMNSASAHKRLSEIAAMGLIARVGSRPCRVTGLRASMWKPRLDVPEVIQPPRPKAADDPWGRIRELEREVQRLRDENNRLRGIDRGQMKLI